MVWTKLFICNIIICLVTSSKLLSQAEEKLNNRRMGFNETQSLKILPGIKFWLTNDKVIVHVKIQNLLPVTEVQSRKRQEDSLGKIGYMMMMAPFVMQILSLPNTIASVKMSLLKSIMVAQLAIAIMIYNLIKSTQNSQTVVVHQKHHYQGHYYHGHNYPKDDEDEWFGR